MFQKKYQKIIKRIFDLLFSLIILISSFPFLAIASVLIKINSPEDSVLFKQERVGYRNNKFFVYKLRTMTNEKNSNYQLLDSESRLKWWGKLVRKTNLDEIPQMINILKGQMSLIGPRPLLPNEMLVMTNKEQVYRQSMLPGISGWEAVHESKTKTRRSMAEYDLYYIDNWSLALDLKIFILTIYVIFANRRPSDEFRAPKI